jgi:chromate transporter
MSTADLGAFAWGDCLALFQHFLTLSLLAVGGAITTVPDMHRFLVLEQHWLSEGQFSASIALAQAAPGPNLLFVSVLAWNVGANAAAGANPPELAWLLPLACASAATIGILAPSTTLTLYAARWVHQNRARLGVRGFKLAMGPIVIGLLLATASLHPDVVIALQPISQKPRATELAMATCIARNWRLSIQTHKYLNID